MECFVYLIIYSLFGAICAAIANSRGRSTVGWFVIGFVIPIIGLILVLVLPNLKVQQGRERRLHLENQRLRERIRKDRQVSDVRHGETTARLGAHDRALGVDTGNRLSDTGPPAAALELPTVPPHLSYDPHELEWFYVRDGGRRGPISFQELRSVWESGVVTPNTLVWNKEQSTWIKVAELPELEEQLGA